ncbi:MAG: ComEC/Rec2 family competence protein [Pseudomonadota bacterium]
MNSDAPSSLGLPLRSAIIAFTLGIIYLQWQAQLPGVDLFVRLSMALLFGGALAWLLCLRRWRWPLRIFVLLLAACCGFAWATWRAELRLAQQLPLAWEGRDIVLQGVVATLPQNFERGQRFEFVVESAQSAQSLSCQNASCCLGTSCALRTKRLQRNTTHLRAACILASAGV